MKSQVPGYNIFRTNVERRLMESIERDGYMENKKGRVDGEMNVEK